MVDRIYGIKNQLIQEVEKNIAERGIERVDGEKVDMIKDLAEAEKACWEAEYYRTVAEAMKEGKAGYSSKGGLPAAGGRSSGGRSGYGAGTGSSAGYPEAGRMMVDYDQMRHGYAMPSGHTEIMEPLRMALQSADPDEREHLRNEVRSMMGMM